jgi:hypothetical protein
MGTSFVDSDVDFICLNLSHIWHSSSQMVLQRIARKASENINQPVVTELSQECLFII